MRRRASQHAALRAVAISVATAATMAASDRALADPSVPCRPVRHEDVAYTVCEIDPARHVIRLNWQTADGQPYSFLSNVPSRDSRSKRPLLLATNAGMFHADLKPVGLYVENGRQLSPISTRSGPGNFHLKPNGVFYIGKAGAGVLETAAYIKAKPDVEFATQSGPMLVINGQLHPRFARAEISKKPRNGVGVRASGVVVLAITDTPASFASFARLYRDVLKCPNALFLDGGSVPTLYAPALQRAGNLRPIGPMLSVYGR